jgi:phosphoadenosine phosphosulfate reductase
VRFRGRIALVSSFGAESAVLLHMISRIDPATPVLFLDTGQLFAQTLDYRRALASRLGLTDVRDLRPAFADLSVTDPRGDLWKSDTDSCCHIRKVVPLDVALSGFDASITGRKRFHGGDRLRLEVEERTPTHVKFNPLANWSLGDLEAYAAAHDLPPHPLVEFGYASVGCWPCTSRSMRRRMSAPAGGSGRTRPNAASTWSALRRGPGWTSARGSERVRRSGPPAPTGAGFATGARGLAAGIFLDLLRLVGEALRQRDDRPAQSRRLYRGVGLQQLKGAGLAQQGGAVVAGIGLGTILEPLDQVADPALEGGRDARQLGEADPVLAPLVLLDLLEGQTDGFAQRGLRHPQRLAPQADVTAQ